MEVAQYKKGRDAIRKDFGLLSSEDANGTAKRIKSVFHNAPSEKRYEDREDNEEVQNKEKKKGPEGKGHRHRVQLGAKSREVLAGYSAFPTSPQSHE